MVKAVFTVKPDSKYRDLPEVCYHFPRTYLKVVERAQSDWAVYYEPRRSSENRNSTGGRSSYFAIAKITSIEKDPSLENHFYAYMSNYLEFNRAVPFQENNRYYESRLKRSDGKTNKGAFGRSVRSIPEQEFSNILQAGFEDLIIDAGQSEHHPHFNLNKELMIHERPLIQQVVTRPFRDAAFSKKVMKAYNETCAITGIRIINGGLRSEAQAAHIQPVAQKGPDSVRNGIALSGTIHWMFDRGLVSISDDFSILIAHARVPDRVMKIIDPSRKLMLPEETTMYPHPQFLKYHRDHIFAG